MMGRRQCCVLFAFISILTFGIIVESKKVYLGPITVGELRRMVKEGEAKRADRPNGRVFDAIKTFSMGLLSGAAGGGSSPTVVIQPTSSGSSTDYHQKPNYSYDSKTGLLCFTANSDGSWGNSGNTGGSIEVIQGRKFYDNSQPEIIYVQSDYNSTTAKPTNVVYVPVQQYTTPKPTYVYVQSQPTYEQANVVYVQSQSTTPKPTIVYPVQEFEVSKNGGPTCIYLES